MALAGLRRLADVAALSVHDPALAVVVEIGLQAFLDDAALQLLVKHRECKLDTPEEIAVHPVGRRKPHIVGAVISEPEHARVLEEAPDDRAHADVLGQPGYARLRS